MEAFESWEFPSAGGVRCRGFVSGGIPGGSPRGNLPVGKLAPRWLRWSSGRQVMLRMQQARAGPFYAAVADARADVMAGLGAASMESYRRAYPFLLKLHGLRQEARGASISASFVRVQARGPIRSASWEADGASRELGRKPAGGGEAGSWHACFLARVLVLGIPALPTCLSLPTCPSARPERPGLLPGYWRSLPIGVTPLARAAWLCFPLGNWVAACPRRGVRLSPVLAHADSHPLERRFPHPWEGVGWAPPAAPSPRGR